MAGLNLLTIGTALGGLIGGYDDARQKQQREQQEQLKSLAAMQTYRQQQQDRQRETQAATGYVKSAQDLPDLSGLGMGQPAGSPTGWGGMGQQPQPRDLTAGLTPPRPAAQPVSFSPPSQSGATSAGYPVPNLGANRQFPALPPNTENNLGVPGPGVSAVTNPTPPKPDNSRWVPGPSDNKVAQLNAQPAAAQTGGAAQPAQPDALIPPHVQQQVQQGAQQTARGIDPMVQGRMSLKALAQTVEKNMPDADPVAKAMVLEKLSKALAPSEQQVWKQFALENRQDFQLALKDMQIAAAGARQDKSIAATDARGADVGWDFITKPDGSIVRANKRTGQVETTTLDAGSSKMSGTPRSLPAMVAQKWKQEHPNATSDDFMRFAGQYKRNQSIEGAFGGGPQSRNMLALNTVADHLSLLQEYAEALRNNDIPKANLILNKFATETGKPEVNNFETARDIAADEVVRLLTQTGGAESDRQGMQAHFKAANSPEQLLGAISVAGRFVSGRMHGLQQGYAGNDPARRKQFEEELMTPEARKWFAGGGAGSASGGQKYTVGQIIDQGGKKYRVTGGDLANDPNVEPVE